MKLDKEIITKLYGPIHAVWGQVGSDCMEADQECGERTTNASAMECVLDANRLTTFGHKDADVLVGELFKEHGYNKVSKFLCKNIKLA